MTSPLWDAPFARGPVLAEVRVPGSKSMTNRALLLAALADGRSTLQRPLRSRDTSIMLGALRALGVGADDDADDAWTVDAHGLVDDTGSTGGGVHVELGNAGTVMRFVPPAAALASAAISFDGDAAIRRRPIGALLHALRELGVSVDDGGRDAAPFVIHGRGSVAGGAVAIDASASSQLVSALLLAGPRYDRGAEIRHIGARPVPNAPHIAMTIAMLRDRGVTVTEQPGHWSVDAGPIAPADTVIEPDLSSAAPFLAAALVTGGRVRILDWPAHSTQPGAMLPVLLEQFGATTALDDDGLVVSGGAAISGAELDLRDGGELTPVLAAVAALASSPSRLLGIDYLRGHETDRIAALARELGALGADVRELDDGLEIHPKPLHGNVFSTYDDHRLAMAAAVIGLGVDGVRVENIETTAKTLPGFAAMWADAVNGQGASR